MAQNDTPVKALVLAGGGARGSYQVGVWRALTELGWRPQIITGTSVGSLNGAMFALDLYETARDMWMSIRSQDVMELPEENADLSELHDFLREVVRDGGMDVTPLEEIVERVLDEDALRLRPSGSALSPWKAGAEAPGADAGGYPGGQGEGLPAGLGRLFPRLRAKQIDGCSSWMAVTGTICPPRWPRRWARRSWSVLIWKGWASPCPTAPACPPP